MTTPGVESTTSRKLRPLVGRAWIILSLTTELTWVFVVSIKGASLETLTLACTPAGSSTSLTVASPPTDTVTFVTFAAEKPDNSPDTV